MSLMFSYMIKLVWSPQQHKAKMGACSVSGVQCGVQTVPGSATRGVGAPYPC